MSERAIRVVDPGMYTTVQDLGRTGWTQVGVPRGGACDTKSLRAGNRLVGNEDGAAALEMTLVGGAFEFLSDAIVVLSGARVDGRIDGRRGTRAIASWAPTTIQSGERMVTGPIRGGARSYLCVAGGIDVPRVLGSRSTYLAAEFGGHEGRTLCAGDHVRMSKPAGRIADDRTAERARAVCESELSRRDFRATDGAHADRFDADTRDEFWASTFKVQTQSDRVGLRLDHTITASLSGLEDGRMRSEGMMHGAVQVPESGLPIVLMADHPTTGGYPVIACVSAVDLAALGQVGPMETIRFEKVSIEAAREMHLEQQRRFDAEMPRHA